MKTFRSQNGFEFFCLQEEVRGGITGSWLLCFVKNSKGPDIPVQSGFGKLRLLRLRK
jgi:hypothetical protein